MSFTTKPSGAPFLFDSGLRLIQRKVLWWEPTGGRLGV